MGTKRKLAVTLSAAALTFAGLAAGFDMTNADCGAKLVPQQIGGTSPVTGLLVHRIWGSDLHVGDGLDIRIEVPVPAKLPGLGSLEEAMQTTMMVTMSRGRTVYAECTVNVSPVVTQRGLLEFAMVVRHDNDQIKWSGGLCDINPWTHGIQEGVPVAYDGDLVKAYIVHKGIMTPVTHGWIAAF